MDHESAVNFGADSANCACLMFRPWVLNVEVSSALFAMLMSLSKLFLFSNEAHLNSGVRLLSKLYCYSDQTCCVL